MIPIRDTIRSERTPLVTWALLAANVLAFLYQRQVRADLSTRARDEVVDAARRIGLPAVPASVVDQHAEQLYAEWVHRYGLVPAEVIAAPGPSELVTFLTSMFLHANWLHLAGNLLFLFIFGDNVEGRLGHGRYLAFYLACGIVAGASQLALSPGSDIPMVGASGAIAGVLGGYLVLFPRARVVLLVPIVFLFYFVEVPAVLFLLFWFVFQNLAPAALSGAAEGGVAYWAHIGGFLAGAAYCAIRRRALVARPAVARPAHPPFRPF